MEPKTKEILDDVKDRLREAAEHRNIADSERILSVAAGAFVLYNGITCMFKSPISGLAKVAVGGGLILRGATGYCPLTESVCASREGVIVDRAMEV
ncbi:DUF2892 domain-containing protein [Parapedobacter deserti]|uniref:DUF2892 domain-containing protein n=1 Tax=Parapedobacter deserti TaxID=1912957 RepID=A0ABV7JTB6_9SPHI